MCALTVSQGARSQQPWLAGIDKVDSYLRRDLKFVTPDYNSREYQRWQIVEQPDSGNIIIPGSSIKGMGYQETRMISN